MKPNIIICISLMVCVCANTFGEKKKRLFYDSKSNIVGVSGDYETISAEGFTTHFFENKVMLPTIANETEGGAYNKKTLLEAFELENTGKRILDYLFQYDNGTLSEDMLKERAWQNVQKADEERAEIGIVDKETILREDYLPILKNNFIYLQRKDPISQKVYWILFKVVITEETLDMVYSSWNNIQAYNQIKVPIKYITQGKFKDKPYNESIRNRHIRSISKKVPEFAIRGQVTSRAPFLAAAGSNNGVRMKDRMYIYSQHADKNGDMYSRKIATARVGKTEDNQSYLYTISGGQASYKRGDIAVLRTDRNFGLSLTGNYMDHSYGLNISTDWRLSFNRHGWSTYLMMQLGAGVYDSFGKRVYAINTEDYGMHLYEAPIILNGGLGFGAGWTFAHMAEIAPYFMGKVEYMNMSIKKTELEEAMQIETSGLGSLGLSIPIGMKFNVNIWYPLQLTLGAEYVINLNIGRTLDKLNEWAAEEDKSDNIIITERPSDYHYIKRDFMEPNNYKRSGLNVFAGFRLVF